MVERTKGRERRDKREEIQREGRRREKKGERGKREEW